MDIKELIEQAHNNAKEKGFWDSVNNIAEKLMLIVSELSKALEADRKNLYDDNEIINKLYYQNYININDNPFFHEDFNGFLKNTFEIEIADCFIRLADLCGGLDIDIEKYIDVKMEYNKSRPRLHGKKY